MKDFPRKIIEMSKLPQDLTNCENKDEMFSKRNNWNIKKKMPKDITTCENWDILSDELWYKAIFKNL